MNKIEIPLNKKKILVGIGASLLFVIAGFYLFTRLADHQTRFNPALVKVIGIAGILFFSATGVYGIKKMFDKAIGLTIDENGIFDNTNASSVGLIKWADIVKIEIVQVASTKFLLIYTTNPGSYLDKAKGLKKRLLQGNHKMYGTPISITATTLKYNFNDLEKLIDERLKEQREK